MFEKAYICFPVEAQIYSNTNHFSVDGGAEIPVSEGTVYYKLPAGAHTVTITSGNGNQWTIERNLHSREVLTIKLDVWKENITGLVYKLEWAPLRVCLMARKLPERKG